MMILEQVAALHSPVVVTGAAALLAHGVPVRVEAVDLAVGSEPEEVEGAVRLLEALRARYYPTDAEDPVPSRPAVETVTVPGPRRLTTYGGAVGIAVDEGIVWVAVPCGSTVQKVTEPGAPLRRHSGRSREDVWSL